jgi:hypothetical protein
MNPTSLPVPPASGGRGLPSFRRKPVTNQIVVHKTGALAAFLRPVGIAFALVILGVPAIFAWNIYSASEARRALHETTVPAGKTMVETDIRRRVADGEVEFLLRQVDDSVVRVIVEKDAVDRLLNRILLDLERSRRQVHEQASAEVDALLGRAFATREGDLDRYADWYFAWGRSWRLLYEALAGATQETLRMGFSRTQINEAARHAVEDYLLRRYRELVLKPSVRDPVIVEGIVSVFRDANARFLAAAAAFDSDVQHFVEHEALYAEMLDENAVRVSLDWDAEKWRAPRGNAEDRYLAPARAVGLAVGGALVLGPIVDRLVSPFFARATTRVLASSRMAAGGAALGSVGPGLGTALGAAGGLAADWGLNAFNDWMNRDQFIADNASALDATIGAWKGRIVPEVSRGIDVWFDDARASLLRLSQR